MKYRTSEKNKNKSKLAKTKENEEQTSSRLMAVGNM